MTNALAPPLSTFYVKQASTTAELDMCAEIRAEVFGFERHIVSLGNITDGKERDRYDDGRSLHILAIDAVGNPAGTFRLILPQDGQRLPIENHFDIRAGDPERSAEMSRLAIRREYRSASSLLLHGLCRLMYDLGNSRTEYNYAIIEPVLYRALRYSGYPFVKLGPPRMLDGDPYKTIPTMLRTSEIIAGLKAQDERRREPLGLAGFFSRPFDGVVTADALR